MPVATPETDRQGKCLNLLKHLPVSPYINKNEIKSIIKEKTEYTKHWRSQNTVRVWWGGCGAGVVAAAASFLVFVVVAVVLGVLGVYCRHLAALGGLLFTVRWKKNGR